MVSVVARSLALGALCAAALAVAASVVAAVGPAKGQSAEYSWPPETLPALSPGEGWYAPLPLLNRVPASLEIEVPCGLAPALRGEQPATVLATARRPEEPEALRLVVGADVLDVSVSGRQIANVPWPSSCPLHVDVRAGAVRLPTGVAPLETGTPDDMPVVTGLFTSLDLRTGAGPRVVLRTRSYATSPSRSQAIATVVAVAAAGAVFLALGLFGGHARRPRLSRVLRSAWDARDMTDAVVVGSLLVWWVVAPTLGDDGWLWVESRLLAESGLDSVYFNNWGVSFPVGFWMLWLGQWTVGSTTDLVFMRIPALVVLLASWPLCRWCVTRVVPGGRSTIVGWVLAATFVLSGAAWLMTLRLEPFISFLALVALAAMVAFAREARLAPLAVAVPATVLAVSIHPVGIVAAAPALAGLPQVARWLRRGGASTGVAVASLVLAALALGLVLVTVDADLGTRLDAARLVGDEELHDEPPWAEYTRYTLFDETGGGTAVRRLSLALLALPVLVLAMRRRSVDTGTLALPAVAVAIGFGLLAFVGSKWPWHFGTMVGVGSVALAAEIGRLLREREHGARGVIRPAAVLVLVGAATCWAWEAVGDWSALDLQEARWDQVFGFRGYSWELAALPFVAFVLLLAGAVRPVAVRMTHVAGWSVVFVSFAVLALTTAILVYNAAISPWAPARQNLEALAGGDSCGLADEVRDVPEFRDRIRDSGTKTLLVPPVGTFFPCAEMPDVSGGVVEIPRYVVHHGDPWPLVTPHGAFAALGDLYELEVVGRAYEAEVLAVGDEIPGYGRADAVRTG